MNFKGIGHITKFLRTAFLLVALFGAKMSIAQIEVTYQKMISNDTLCVDFFIQDLGGGMGAGNTKLGSANFVIDYNSFAMTPIGIDHSVDGKYDDTGGNSNYYQDLTTGPAIPSDHVTLNVNPTFNIPGDINATNIPLTLTHVGRLCFLVTDPCALDSIQWRTETPTGNFSEYDSLNPIPVIKSDQPYAPILGQPQDSIWLAQDTVCFGDPDTVTVTPSGAAQYRYFINGINFFTGGPSDTTFIWNTGGAGNDTVWVEYDSCGTTYYTDTVIVYVLPLPNPFITPTFDPPCFGDTVSYFTGVSTNDFNWTVINGTVIAGGGIGDNFVDVWWNVTDTGTVIVEEYNASCSASDTFEVSIGTNPKPDLGNDTTVCGTLTLFSDITPCCAGTPNWYDGTFAYLGSGMSYVVPGSGTYIVEVDSASNGCFQYDTIVVTFSNPPTITGTDSVCPGDLNIPYSTGSVVNWTLISSNGSSINGASAGVSNITIDFGNITGIGYDTLIADNAGCADTLVITIDAVNANAGNDTTICEGDTATLNAGGSTMLITDYFDLWEDQTTHGYTAFNDITQGAGAYDCGTNNPIRIGDCGSTLSWVEVTMAVTPGTDVIQLDFTIPWKSGNTAIYVDGMPAGNLPAGNGCNIVSTTVPGVSGLTGDGFVVIRIADEIPTSCSGNAQINEMWIRSQAPAAYTWNEIPGIFISNSPSIQVTPSVTTDYELIVQNGTGCIARDTVTVTVTPAPKPNLGPDVVSCDSTLLVSDIVPTGGGFINWYDGGGAFIGVGQSIAVFSSDSYVVEVDSAGIGCSRFDTINVTINPAPSININGGPTASCLGDTAFYTTQIGAYTYTWSNFGGTAITGNNLDTYGVVWTSTGADTVFLQVDSLGCTTFDTVVVNVSTPPTPSITGPTNVCHGDTVGYIVGNSVFGGVSWDGDGGQPINILGDSITIVWDGTPNGYNDTLLIAYDTSLAGCVGADTIQITINGPEFDTLTISGCDSVFAAGQWHFGNTSFNDTVAGVSSQGCDSIYTYNIFVNPPVFADAGPDSVAVCLNDVLNLSSAVAGGGSGVLTYLWTDPTTSLNNVGFLNPDFDAGSGVTAGYYQHFFTVTDDSGCFATDSIMIRVVDNPTPNIVGSLNVCQPDSQWYVNNTSTVGSSHTWFVTGGLIIQDLGDSILVDWNGVSGLQTVQVDEIIATCTTTVNINVNVNETPIIDAGLDTVCSDASESYTTTFVGGHFWQINSSIGSVISGPNGNLLVDIDFGTTNVNVTDTLIISAASGCSDTLYIVVQPGPTIAGVDSICANSIGVNFSTGATAADWTILSSIGSVLIGGPNGVASINVDFGTTNVIVFDTLIAMSNGCPDTHFVRVDPLPSNTILGPASSCIGSIDTFYAVSPAQSYNWVVSANGVILSGAANDTVVVQWNFGGASTVSLTSTVNGCDSTIVHNLPVQNPTTPTINPSPAAQICAGDSVLLATPLIALSTYQWTLNGVAIGGATGTTYLAGAPRNL